MSSNYEKVPTGVGRIPFLKENPKHTYYLVNKESGADINIGSYVSSYKENFGPHYFLLDDKTTMINNNEPDLHYLPASKGGRKRRNTKRRNSKKRRSHKRR
jgi:hypothetical protein